MSIQAITRVIPPILEEASSVTNRSDSISTTQDVVASATASVTNGSDSILTTQNVVESATSSNTQATSQKASRVRRCWDRMTAVFCCNTSRADVALSNNVSIENVALIGSAVQNKTERLASDLVNLQDRVSLASGSDSISTTQNVVESATSSNTQATSQKASRVRRCWDRMTAVLCCNTSRADVALSNNVSIENVALIGSAVQNKTERLASDLVNLQDRVSLASGSDSISTTQDVVASATAMSSDTQATSKNADLVTIRGLVSLLSGLKESDLHSDINESDRSLDEVEVESRSFDSICCCIRA